LAAARTLALDVEALALPHACLGCQRRLAAEEEAEACCAVCRHRMRRIAPPVCERCGQPLDRWSAQWAGETPHCEFCAVWPAELAWAVSAVWLEDGPAKRLVHALKYGGWQIAATPMAAVMAAAPGQGMRRLDALVPVPLGRTRRRERGYNQAAVLAIALGARLGVPVLDTVLRRTRDTRTQTRLAPAGRWSNVSGAFDAAGAPLGGMHVALVDDVVTTGATLGAAARALAALRPASIGAATFARASVPA
jgi:ComF family protein